MSNVKKGFEETPLDGPGEWVICGATVKTLHHVYFFVSSSSFLSVGKTAPGKIFSGLICQI